LDDDEEEEEEEKKEEEEEEGQGRFVVTENWVPLGLMKVTGMGHLKGDHTVTVNATKLKIGPKIHR
jgi:hypothetical protein